jgi:hypothetical protein
LCTKGFNYEKLVLEEMLARLGLTEEPLVAAVTALDEHIEEDERTEVPPQRHFPDWAEPPALLAVVEKVLAADVAEERAMQAIWELRGSEGQRLLAADAEAVHTEEASLEWRRPSQDAWPESRVAVTFASEVLWIFR